MSGNKRSKNSMKIGLIGCGTMGSAIAKSLAASHDLYLFDRNPNKAQQLALAWQGSCCQSPLEILQQSEIVILAVKPKDLIPVGSTIKDHFLPEQLLVSVLAGTTIQTLKKALNAPLILRMMPNLAINYGKGVIGLCESDEFDIGRQTQIEEVFSGLGLLKWLPESKIDALSSLTGSGPAFVCVVIEAMVDAAIAMGFSPSDGLDLVFHMLNGTVAILEESKKHPGEIKWQVASPEGTTIAGIRAMEAGGVRSGILEAFIAAYVRSRELSAKQQ